MYDISGGIMMWWFLGPVFPYRKMVANGLKHMIFVFSSLALNK
jgi:hypothetical protein